MKRYKTAALLLLCLLCALTLSACYTDADPWPASPSAAPAAVEGGAADEASAFPDGGTSTDATAAPADTHELDTGSDPGLNG